MLHASSSERNTKFTEQLPVCRPKEDFPSRVEIRRAAPAAADGLIATSGSCMLYRVSKYQACASLRCLSAASNRASGNSRYNKPDTVIHCQKMNYLHVGLRVIKLAKK